MPGRRLFSWRHSGLSCKSQCTRAETADVLIDVADDADARSSSFSISSMASSSSTMQAEMQVMSSKTSRISRGCSSPAQSITKQQQQQLHDDQPDQVNMIHGCNNIYSSKIAVMMKLQQQQQQSCSTASSPGAAASCSSSNSNSNNSARKSTDHSYYIHQTQTGEYYYKAPAAAADHKVKRGNSKSLQAAGKIMITNAGGIFRTCRHADDLTTAATAGDNNNNMCLVRGCCECSSIMQQQQQQQACSESWNSNSISSSFQAYPAFVAEYHHVDAAAGTGSAAAAVAASHNRSSSSSSAAPKCVCPKCGEAFSTAEVLELHKVSHHAVSQLKNGNSSLNVVEIIFKTSWVQQQKQQQTKKDHESSTTAPAAAAVTICSSSTTSATAAGPAPKIEWILKIENKETAIHEFEEYRNKVKERNAPATAAAHDHHYSSYNNSSSSRDHLAGMNMISGKSRKKKTVPVILLQQQGGGGGAAAAADQRCVADGNELLRFFATSLSCCLGNNGCTNLCSLPNCNVCNIIRWGFVNQRGKGIYTTATSGRAHQVFISKQEPENLQLLELRDQQQHEQQPPPPQQKNLIKTRNFLSTHLGKCKNKTHEMKMKMKLVLKMKKMKVKLMLKMKKKKKKQLQPEQYGMFVCRVIAGRIQKLASDQKLPALPAISLLPQGYDSVAQEYCSSPGAAGSSSSSSSSTVSAHLDDLFVFDSKAVLPCFLVVYSF